MSDADALCETNQVFRLFLLCFVESCQVIANNLLLIVIFNYYLLNFSEL